MEKLLINKMLPTRRIDIVLPLGQYTTMENQIRALRKQHGLTQADLADTLGVTIAQVSKWESGKVDLPTSRLMALAEALKCSVGALLGVDGFDIMPDANALAFRMEGASLERMREDLPIYGTALGAVREIDGEAIEQTTLNKAEVLQYAKRPTILNGNASAYGLYIAGSSMEPRYMDGEMLLADPKGRVRAGEDVIVYLRPRNEVEDDGETARAALVKRLVRRTASYIELEQYSPAKVFRIEMVEVLRIDRVIPWHELLG